MGKLLTSKASKKAINSKDKTCPISKETGLYKPLSDFAWKDASPAEIHKNSIKAYNKLAF